MMYPLVRDLAADGDPRRGDLPGAGFSKQAFYKWSADPVTQRDWDDAHLINAALDIHADDPAFGYRFIADELADARHHRRREPGRTAVLAAAASGRCSPRSGPEPQGRAAGARRPRRAGVHRRPPNELWLTDITEHPTAEGKLYLCAIKDVYSNRIVGYSIDSRMKASLAVAALRNAVALRDPAGTVVHSDRGSQFRSANVRRTLRDNGLHGSMGRVGACGDNAAMESFFSLLQKNVLDRRRWTHPRRNSAWRSSPGSRRTYHRRRRQRRLGRLTPIEFETLNQTAHAA